MKDEKVIGITAKDWNEYKLPSPGDIYGYLKKFSPDNQSKNLGCDNDISDGTTEDPDEHRQD